MKRKPVKLTPASMKAAGYERYKTKAGVLGSTLGGKGWRPLYPTGYAVAQALRQADKGGLDVERAVLLVERILERQGRRLEAAALKLEWGFMAMRSGLHELEHPGPVGLSKAFAKATEAGSRVEPRVSGVRRTAKSSRRGQD